MLARSWISLALPVALPLVLGACGGDKDGGTDPNDTGPTGGTPPASALEAFEGNDWYGTATRGSVDFPCEADLTYDAAADEVTGTMDVDGVWDVVLVEGDDGSVTGTGTPFFGDDTFTVVDLAVGDDGAMTGSWTIDYGGSTSEGTFDMSTGGPG